MSDQTATVTATLPADLHDRFVDAAKATGEDPDESRWTSAAGRPTQDTSSEFVLSRRQFLFGPHLSLQSHGVQFPS